MRYEFSQINYTYCDFEKAFNDSEFEEHFIEKDDYFCDSKQWFTSCDETSENDAGELKKIFSCRVRNYYK